MPNLIYAEIPYTHGISPDSVAETELRLSGVSIRARKLYKRLCDGEWYTIGSDNTPAAMLELLGACLVKKSVRTPVLEAAYVPHDTISTTQEVIVNASNFDPQFDEEFRGRQKAITKRIEDLEREIRYFRDFQTAHRLIGVE